MKSVCAAMLFSMSSAAMAACGPDAAPSQAAAVGFTCETFWDGNPWTLATVDVNNTGGAPWSATNPTGYKWWVNMNWPHGTDTAWKTQGINSPGDFSISGGKLVFAPTGTTGGGPGVVHYGAIISCNQIATPPYYQGFAFTGGFYYQVVATWPNGTAHGSDGNWPNAWTAPISFLISDNPNLVFTEMDNFEAPYERAMHRWTYSGGSFQTNAQTYCSTGGGTCANPTVSGTKYGVLLVPQAFNGGNTGKYDWYENDVFKGTAVPPTGFTQSVFQATANESHCLLIGAAQSNPATFISVGVWQVPPPTGGSSGR
jgi:hypothetical protein